MDEKGSREDKKGAAKSRVKVAIRVRPMVAREKMENQSSCIEFKSASQIVIGGDRGYKFDRVFSEDSPQRDVYEHCIKELVMNCFEGYNAAVLAYGQTGSGKTFTMGTSISTLYQESTAGIIPRVIKDIFQQVEQRSHKAQFVIKASFIQIYNEQIIDLLTSAQLKNIRNKDSGISIREEKDGSISIYGVNEEKVTNADQMVKLLEKGGFNRTTASTLMNEASSRSHAIFTVFIEQHIIEDLYKSEEMKQDAPEEGFMTAKFFFVDLAGSERAKKTGATGATLQEGININQGLFQLGNVISALATIDKNQKEFIKFRNSKLTRILQDCLGGNSNTYMIACVSPAESNFEESLNTLKYASKAMNIKNTPVINRDPQSALVSQLRQRIFELQGDNRKYKQMLNSKGVTIEQANDNSDEMTIQLKKVKDQNNFFRKSMGELTDELQSVKRRLYEQEIKMHEVTREKDILLINFEQLLKENPQLSQSQSLRQRFLENEREKISVLDKHLQHIQILEMRLIQKENAFKQLQFEYNTLLQNSMKDEKILIKKNILLSSIGKENLKLKKELAKYNHSEQSEIDILKSFQNPINQARMQEQIQQIYIIQNAEMFEQDEVIQQHQEDYLKRQQKTHEEMNKMDEYILEKQHFLEKMSKELLNQETELLNSMKNQNHEKIRLLEKQIKTLQKQKDECGIFDKSRFVNKIQKLQNELKDFRKKEKEQSNMKLKIENQNNHIRNLNQKVQKAKAEKLELARKLKEDKNNYENIKKKRIKEILQAKREANKKTVENKRLVIENFMNKQVNKKQDQEIKRLNKVNATLNSSIKTSYRRENIMSTNSLTSSMNLAHFVHQQDVKTMQREQQDYLSHIIKLISMQIDRETHIAKYMLKMEQSTEELNVLLNDQSMFKLKLERIKLKEDDEMTEEDVSMQQELELNLSHLKERINNCEKSINLCKSKYASIVNQRHEYFDVESFILYNKNYDHGDRLKHLIKATFKHLKKMLSQRYKMTTQHQKMQHQIKELRDQVNELKDQIINMNTEHYNSLMQMKEEMMMNRSDINIEESDLAPISSNKRYEDREKKELEKKIQDLTKTNRQVSAQLEKTRRKCEVVQEKYQNIKNLVSKDKNIGRQGPDQVAGFVKPDKTDNSKRQIAEKLLMNKAVIEQIDGMFNNYDRLKKVRSSTALENYIERQSVREERMVNEGEQTINRWECNTKIEAHCSSILSVAAHSNILISTATKSLKIWDLQKKKPITELGGPNLAGSVKFTMIDPTRKLFFTACDKIVTIWDLPTLKVQVTLKCHKDEVRAIHNTGDYLFTGGKGSTNGGSLLIWDLRKLNPNHALEEKEKNQDIFTFTSKENTLFYGTRNHSVRRMNIRNLDILSPFEPPHMDSVTGLAIVKNKLISGSKDKNLKLWSLDYSINNAKHTFHIFNDYVNTVYSPFGHSFFYAGSKDGQVKVCYTKNDRIEVMGGILAHTQSVNALCSLEENPYSLISASQDRTIKIWQPTKETMENMSRQDYF